MYAAEINNNIVIRVIVGDPEWATANLGGEWVGSESKVGTGWLLMDGALTPPPAPEIDDSDQTV